MTTRIDFHSNVSNQLEYAYRLIRKALAAQCKLMVLLQDEDQLAQLDQLLWEYSPTDFLPHVVLKQSGHPLAQHTPVLLMLASGSETFNDVAGITIQPNIILINLSETAPANVEQFQRLIEIVPKETAATQAAIHAGRHRYRLYQQQGYQLNHVIAK